MDCSGVTADDICALTDTKRHENRSENQAIIVTPSRLKFAFNNAQIHTAPITVWNKTKQNVRFRILLPQTDIFQVYCDQIDVFANSEATIYVKCKPRNIQICVDCLEIQVRGQKGIRIPLEVLPSVDWFALPKFLCLPLASLDKRVEARIDLPIPNDDQVFEFCIISALTPYFSVLPRSGKIGGLDGVTSLLVAFQSHEYVTLAYKLEIKFLGTDSPPYEINVFGRCVPNLDNEEIRKDLASVEALTSEVAEKKDPKPKDPRFRLKANNKKDNTISTESDTLNLFTPGGIMKFLIQKNSKDGSDPSFILGPLGVSIPKSLAVYHQKREEFHNELNKAEIKQANLSLQHNKERIGADSSDFNSDKLKETNEERERQEHEYAKAAGVEPNNPADLTRSVLERLNQRSVRLAGSLPIPQFGAGDNFTDERFFKDLYRVKRAILHPFIQAARTFITQWRADERLKKLAILKKQMLEDRQQSAEEVVDEKKPTPYNCYGPRGEYPTCKDYEIAKVIEKLRAKELRDHLDHINNHLQKLHNKLNEDLEQIKSTIQAPSPYDSDYETAEGEDEQSDIGRASTLDLVPYFERINESINRLQHKINNDAIATEQHHINNEILRLLGFPAKEEPPRKSAADKAEILAFPETALLMNDINEAIDELQEIIVNPVLNAIQNKINNIADTLKIPGKPDKSYFSDKYNKDLTPGGTYPTPLKLEEYQQQINAALNNLQKKLRNSVIKDLQEGINAEINSLKGYKSDFGNPSFSSNTLADDVDPEDVKELLNQVNIDLEKLQNKVGSSQIDDFHSRANSTVADLLDIDPYETNFQRKQQEAFEKAQKLPTEDLINHMRRINLEINKLVPYKIDYDGISAERFKINDEILGYLEARGIHPDEDVVNTPTRPSILKLATPAELKIHQGEINEAINALQKSISNPAVNASQKRINRILEKELKSKAVDPEELRHLREKLNKEMTDLQHLAKYHPAIEEQQNRVNKELNRFLPPASEVTSNLANIHKAMLRLNDEIDQVQVFLRNPEINANQLDTNRVVDDLLSLPPAKQLGPKYAQKEMTQEPVEIPVPQVKDHQNRINSEFRNLLDSVKDPRLETYQNNINFELNKAIQNHSKPSEPPTKEAMQEQFRNLSKVIENLQKIIASSVIDETVPHIQEILKDMLGELVDAPKDSQTEKELLMHQDEVNNEIDKLKDKLSDNLVETVDKIQKKMNQEINDLLGRRDTLQLKKASRKQSEPISNQDLNIHKKSINKALENLLEKIVNPNLQKNKEEINAIIDRLMRTKSVARPSVDVRGESLMSEKKINKAILDLFDLDAPVSEKEFRKADAFDSDEQLLVENPITAEDLASYQDKLNELYAKILDKKPHLGIYKNRMAFNDIMDNLRNVSDADKFKSKPLFDPSQHLETPSIKELKQIRRDYNSVMSELQAELQNKDLENVQKEFIDLINGLIIAQGGSLEDDRPELDLQELIDLMKSSDEELANLSELLPGAGVDEIRKNFHKNLIDLIHSVDPSYIDEGIPEASSHVKKAEDIDPKAVEALRRLLNGHLGELIEKTLDGDIAKNHRDLNHALDQYLGGKQGRGSGKKSATELLRNLQGLNDGLNALRGGKLDKQKPVGFDDIQSDINDEINRHLRHAGMPSFSATSTHFPEFPKPSEGHDITTQELIRHQAELNRYFDNLKVKTSTDKVEELQDDFNKKIANYLVRKSYADLFPPDQDSEGVKNLQKANDIIQNMRKILGPDSELSRLASLIDDDISRVSTGSSNSSLGSISNDPTPKELEKRRRKIQKYMEGVPKELLTPAMKKHFDDLNSWFEKEKEKGRSKILNRALQQINREIEKLQDVIENEDVADLQENLNSEIFDLLDLPPDENLLEKITQRQFRSSRKISASVTADQLNSHKKKIDDAIDSLPSSYKTKDVRRIKKALDDKIDYLQNRLDLNKGVRFVEKYIKEIDALQEVIMNGDVGEVANKLQEEFSKHLKLPSNYWKSFKPGPFSQDMLAQLLAPKELAQHRDKIAKAFDNIPARFRNPPTTKLHKTLMNLIKAVTKKMAGDSQRAQEEELGQDITDLQVRIAADIRNLRNKIFAEVQLLEYERPLDAAKIDKAQRKIHSDIFGVRDKISFEIEKLFNKVKGNKNLKNKQQHLQSIKNLHGVTSNGINTLLNEVDELLDGLRGKLGLKKGLERKSRDSKIPKKKLKRSDSDSTQLIKICLARSIPDMSLQASTTTLQPTKTCYYVKGEKKLAAKSSAFGISLPSSDTRLITPIPSFLDKQKLRDISKVDRCAFNLSSRSAEKLVQELRRINQ